MSSRPETDPFYNYYAEQSVSSETIQRFEAIRRLVDRLLQTTGHAQQTLKVADVGCGAGTQSIMWARDGHRTHGIDINNELIELARKRALDEGLAMQFTAGTASALPWETASMDVCLVPELLEHVAEWELCLDEFARVLKPGGALFLSTNNTLCPIQQEFDLPLYSWYPGFVKRRCEQLAVTAHPEWVNHAQFPAVNWFTFYQLKTELRKRGLTGYDRFDVTDENETGRLRRLAVALIRKVPPLRFAAHVCTPYTAVLAVKDPA